MTNLQLLLNDQPVDLSGDSPIALTFQINDLGEVQNQQGNTSNQFKIPLTQNNRAILGYADDISMQNAQLSTQIPYTKLAAKVIQNGIEILPNAIAEINQIDNDTASITVLSGNVDFFDALGGQIADMGDSTSQWSNYGATLPWKQFDHKWNLQNVVNSQTHTQADGWIYPIVDYGLISQTDFSQIDIRNQRPGFFIKKAIDLLVQSTGFVAKGSLLSDPLYPILIAQFSNSSFDHGLDYQNQVDLKGIICTNAINQSFLHNVNSTNKGFIYFNTVLSDPSNQFDHSTTFTASDRENVDISVTIPKFYFYGHVDSSHPSSIKISIYLQNGSDAAFPLAELPYDFTSGYDQPRDSGDGGGIIGHKTYGTQTLSYSTELAAGQKISIRYEFFGDQPTSFTLYSGATFQIKSQNKVVELSQDVQCERILPDMSQKDFLKDTLQRFGVICQTDVYTKTINFASLKDIISNIPIAKDWTSKCIDQGKQVNYKLGNYAQVNNMEYQTDPNILPLKFGWDQIIINDQTLSTIPGDMIVSKFGPSLNRPYIGGTIAQITMIDATSDSTDLSIGVAPRILIDQKTDLRQNGNKTINFTDGTTTTPVNGIISTPYFYKPDGDYNLCWCDMDSSIPGQKIKGVKSNYYTDLQKILQNTKVLVRYFLLTPRDIAELDLLIPVYLQQHNAYFYINKIDSWIKGQPVKVELVKLG
jgi:hypothetical protein